MTHRRLFSSASARATALELLSFWILLVFAAPAAAAGATATGPHIAGGTSAPLASRLLLTAACPGASIRLSDLDAVRNVNHRTAIEAALREAAATGARAIVYDAGDDGVRYHTVGDVRPRWHASNDPREIAVVLREHYGPGSLVARGARGVAALADAAEQGTQVPLDRANAVADAIVDAGRRIPGLENMPAFELRSHIVTDEASVTLSTSW